MAQKSYTFITETIPANAVSVLPAEENFTHPHGLAVVPKPKYKVTVVVDEPEPPPPRKMRPPPPLMSKLPPPRLSNAARRNMIGMLGKNPMPRPAHAFERKFDALPPRQTMQPRHYAQLRAMQSISTAPAPRGMAPTPKMAMGAGGPSRPAAGYGGGRGVGVSASAGGGAAGGPK